MKLRLVLLTNNGRIIVAVEDSVTFHPSIRTTLKFFNVASRLLGTKMVHWLAGNQDEFVQLVTDTKPDEKARGKAS